jgi:hypothetical protein
VDLAAQQEQAPPPGLEQLAVFMVAAAGLTHILQQAFSRLDLLTALSA